MCYPEAKPGMAFFPADELYTKAVECIPSIAASDKMSLLFRCGVASFPLVSASNSDSNDPLSTAWVFPRGPETLPKQSSYSLLASMLAEA